jgi:hypothetical protein
MISAMLLSLMISGSSSLQEPSSLSVSGNAASASVIVMEGQAVAVEVPKASESADKLSTQPEVTDLPELAQMLTKAVLDKNYMMIAGVLLMLVVLIFRKFILPKIALDEKLKSYIPLITLSLSVMAGVGTWFLNPKLNLVEVMVASLGIGLSAIGSFEMMMKPILGLFKNKLESVVNKDSADATKTS